MIIVTASNALLSSILSFALLPAIADFAIITTIAILLISDNGGESMLQPPTANLH